MSNIDADWRDVVRAATIDTTTQETPVTDQENPAVSKLREAFDTARNAIIEGSELAKVVENLRTEVTALGNELATVQRDLQYVRTRNRELDEQVTEVRRQRDNATREASELQNAVSTLETILSQNQGLAAQQSNRISMLETLLANAAKERDDAMTMALEYEGKFKEAAAKLAKIEEAMHGVKSEEKPMEKPVPHYEVQPRDEVGKFQPFDEAKTLDHGTQGSY